MVTLGWHLFQLMVWKTNFYEADSKRNSDVLNESGISPLSTSESTSPKATTDDESDESADNRGIVIDSRKSKIYNEEPDYEVDE